MSLFRMAAAATMTAAVTAIAVIAVAPAAQAQARAQGGGYTVKAKIRVQNGPLAAVVDSWAGKLYVANSPSSSVSVISTATDAVIKTIKLGCIPAGIAVNVRTARLFVTCSGDQVVVIGVKADKVIHRIKLAGMLWDLTVNPVTDRVYVPVDIWPGTAGEVSVINGSTNQVTGSIKVNEWLFGIAANLRTNKIYAAGTGHVVVIDGRTDSISKDIGVSYTMLARVAVNQRTNMTYVVAPNNNAVVVVNGRSGDSSGPIATGHYPYAIAVNTESGILYVTCVSGGTVWMIDAASGKKLTSIAPGSGPDGIAYFGNSIYEVNRDNGTAWVITTPAP